MDLGESPTGCAVPCDAGSDLSELITTGAGPSGVTVKQRPMAHHTPHARAISALNTSRRHPLLRYRERSRRQFGRKRVDASCPQTLDAVMPNRNWLGK